MKKHFNIVLFLLFSAAITAQKLNTIQQNKVNDLFKGKTVVYFKFPVASMQEASALAKIISIDSNKGTMIFAHATKDAFSKFIVKNYAYTIVPHGVVKGKVKPKSKKAVKPKAATTKPKAATTIPKK